MKKRVGIINSGGDCPGLNTVIDAIVKRLHSEYEILGFIKGFEGLLDDEFIILTPDVTSNIRWIGGTILKSVNKGRFPGKVGKGYTSEADELVIQKSYKNYQKHSLEGLIVIGGDGSLTIANNLMPYGFNIVGVPKSIDNDLDYTDFTFGFNTAIEITNDALDKLHTTATSHDRVMILEVMGRHAGWIGLYSGIAGGANMILIPEIGFKYENILDFLQKRIKNNRKSSIIVVSEGAKALGEELAFKKSGDSKSEGQLGGIGDRVANYLNENGVETRCTVLGHIQRGGSPNSFDKVLSTRLGEASAEIFLAKQYGYMVTYKNNAINEIEISKAVEKLKLIDPNDQIIKQAKGVGISFGD